MGTFQTHGMEISCKMKLSDTQKHNVHLVNKSQNASCLSLSNERYKQLSGVLEELGSSAEGTVKASTGLDIDRMARWSSLTQEVEGLFSPSQDSNDALATSVAAMVLNQQHECVGKAYQGNIMSGDDGSKTANVSIDPFSECVKMLGDPVADAEDGSLLPNAKTCEQSFLRKSSEENTFLSNLGANEAIRLGGFGTTTSFLNMLNSFPQKSPVAHSRKKLLILDINGLLADIVYPPPKDFKADTKIGGRAIFKRPFCSDFLSFCFARFDVGIWSSRSKKSMDRLVDYLLGDMKHKLTFCWKIELLTINLSQTIGRLDIILTENEQDLSHCTESKFRTLENRHKALVFKELTRLWERYDPTLPWKNGEYNETNTLLLDDSPYKALLNPPNTAIFPHSYNFNDRADNSIGSEGNIRIYLERLSVADNVQEFVRQHPFGQSAINERSLSWCFYRKVLKNQCAISAGG